MIALVQETLRRVTVYQDVTPERAILRVDGYFGPYRVCIVEILSRERREYRYYVLEGNRVVAGFDNAPDVRALKERYGDLYRQHMGEAIPHVHWENKTRLELTEDITLSDFLEWLRTNLSAFTGGHHA